MTDRVLEFAEKGAYLSLKGALLAIQPQDQEEVTLPLKEVAVVVASHPQVTFSHPVLAALAQAGVMVVVSGPNHLPAAMLLPVEGHFTQSERFARQAALPLPVKKQLWRHIAKAKVAAQGRLLHLLHGADQGLGAMAARIKSGDADNVEAQAARRYWGALFADPDFHRERTREDQNRFLNYGYTVLRAAVARAVCAAGLHPSLGLHHHNRYDAFCLADDLMEPLRPVVDAAVVRVVNTHGPQAPMDKTIKETLLTALLDRFDWDGEQRTLFDISARMAQSLAAVVDGKKKRMILPEI